MQSFKTGNSTLYLADSLDVMRTMESNSVDSIVTDPPYGLKFMGKGWDHGIPGVPYWSEALRVVKPGAFLLAFGGTRTFHRLACAIEDAGWEIRDTVMWVYGSGFPKSLDVSKAIDKAGEWNAEFDEVRTWLRKKVNEKGLKHAEIDRAIGNENSHMASHFLGNSQPMLPTWDQWVIIKELLGVDEDIDRPPKCIGYERAIISYRKVNRGVAFSSIGPTELPVTEPASEKAKLWSGWGTALKPAYEPIIVARKPLEGTVAENVLKWGVAGLNIDGGRVEGTKGVPVSLSNAGLHGWHTGGDMERKREQSGRFPTNLIHDGSQEVLELFPLTKSGEMNSIAKAKQYNTYGKMYERRVTNPASNGSAARFFYCAKASKSEREAGLFGRAPCVKCGQMNSETHKNEKGQMVNCVRNGHPTVKPIALMRYLCRLVTPPGRVILDLFMGSGSTGLAAELEGFRFIGIDQERESFDIACGRISGE